MKAPDPFRHGELTAALWMFRREFLVVGLFGMVANLMMLVPTIYMLQVFDRVMRSRSEITLLAVSLIALFLLGVMAFCEWSRARVLVRTGVRLDEQLGARVFDASFESHLDPSDAEPSRAFADLAALRQFVTGSGLFALFDAPWAPIHVAVIFFLHPFLGAVSLVFVAVQGALAWFGHRRAVVPCEHASRAAADAQAYLQGKLRNAEVIESMGMLGNLRHRWRHRHNLSLAANARAQGASSRAMAWSKFIRYSQQSLALAAGAVLVIKGQLTPGAMIATNLLMARALAPIDQLVSGWHGFIAARAAFHRLDRLLADHPPRNPQPACPVLEGRVSLRDVTAGAPGRAAPILQGIGFSVPAGTVTAILGPSGSGKSTLGRVIMGIWPDMSGQVLVDGLPIQGGDRIALGPRLGYLPQEIELFDATVGENIARLGELDAGKVIEAARCTGLHEMILRLPKGYDTRIGEAGCLLSGGQRQRIGLARAVYGDPAVLVLDEPAAHLDEAGEAALVRALRQLKARGATVFLITHRGSALTAADRVLVLRGGRICADGPREAVLAGLGSQQPSRPQPPVRSREAAQAG